MKKILVIDDDETFLKTICDAFKNSGYKVVEAHDGQEGMIIVEKEAPDLIILDLVMPKMGGIDFLKMLHKDKSSNKIPVLITSNFSGSEKINEGIEYGVRGYIVKSDESLKTIVNAVESIIVRSE